ncbi:MAG: divalent-cation tolerance protein CutA [Candidatus Aminicenantes bacterium]|nr:MAG: divalent-cation tolerance protein CutA [Candidatus Aminicenantes bacterium]
MTTVPDEEEGQKIAHKLVKDRLAACVTISAASKSYYWWQGNISEEKEYILFIKTQDSLYPELEKKLLKIHPYDVPEIVALPILKGFKKYLNWITEETP